MEAGIRNVIVIDGDSKIRREILQYLKELEAESVEEFASLQEFEKTMFAELTQPAKPEKTVTLLSTFSPDTVKFLNVTQLSMDRPFNEESIAVEISLPTSQILKVDVSKIFGRTVPELVAHSTSLETFVVPDFKADYDALLAGVKAKGTAEAFLCFKDEKSAVWAMQVAATGDDKAVRLTITNITKKVLKELGRIDEPVEEPPKPKFAPDVIIFRGSLCDDIRKWVTRAAALLKKANLWPAENRPRFVVVRYEDEPGEKSDLNHPFIDDLLFIPFDRLIFLQKLEVVFGLPKKVTPNFLFVQETREPVEMAKRVRVERINDLGMAVVNPVPLQFNTPAHFYFRFPGQKPLIDVWAKATHSIPHPEREGDQLVFFSFFGLSRQAYREIRQYLNRDVAYKPMLDTDPTHFEYNPDNIFLNEEQKRKKTVAVLDYDEQQRRSLVDSIRKEIHNLDIVAEDTFFTFFKKYLERAPEEKKAPPASPADLYADTVSFLVSVDGYKMQMPLSVPNDEDTFLGYNAREIFDDQDKWLDLFSASDTKNLLMECFHLARSTRRILKTMELKCADGSAKSVNVEFIMEDGGKMVRMNVSAMDPRSSKSAQQTTQIESLEVIVIHATLLTEDVTAMLNSVKDACARNGISTPPGGPRLIVYSEENQKIPFEKMLSGPVVGLLFKPLEIRRLLYMVTMAVESPYSPYVLENIGWKEDTIHAKIAKDATLVEISEFGSAVESDGPLKPGTILFLFKSIYVNAPDTNLCVRVYHSQEIDRGKYLNSVIYFGITDAFLKFTRAYIRDSYAAKKAQEGKG